jgi:hypothetical protein
METYGGKFMIFGLNKLGITPNSFRLLYSIMTAAYYHKVWDTTYGVIVKESELSLHKVRASLNELRSKSLVTTKSSTDGIKIILGSKLLEMIYLDCNYKQKGASQRTRSMTEIKKSQPPKQEGEVTVNCQTSSMRSLTPIPPQNISRPSLKNTFKNKVLAEATSQSPEQIPTTPQKPPTKPPTTNPPSTKSTTSQKLKASDKKPYVTTRGTLYKFFEDWLKYYEQLSDLDIVRIKKDEEKMMRYWRSFQDHARYWLSRNRQIEKPERNINKIKMMKQFAALAKVS